MTEEEAKTKWCPMVQFREAKGIAVNNRNAYAEHPESHLCIGSACMMWRRSVTYDPPHANFNEWPSVPQRAIPSQTDGWCGLAGRP